jgi:hypothetical protein
MVRRLLTFATALSLVLCAATAALWVRSYWACDTWAFQSRSNVYRFAASRNRVQFNREKIPASGRRFEFARGSSEPLDFDSIWLGDPWPHDWYFAGCGASWDASSLVLLAPCWLIAAAFAATPAAWSCRFGVRRRQWRRRHEKHCPQCGYDLRASPDRCPECGTAAPKGG